MKKRVYGRAMRSYWMLLLATFASCAYAQFSIFTNPFSQDSIMRASPNARSAPANAPHGFSDQSAYVGLSASGALVATADFNQDRFVDLLMLDTKSLRRLSVMQWQHDSFSFQHTGAGIDLHSVPLVSNLKPPFRKISGVHVGDFGNDGRVDVLVMDGTQGLLFFSDGDANFNASSPVHIAELPPTNAMVDADGDLVPDIFVAFENGTRGFYSYERRYSVRERRFDQSGSIKFHEWKHGVKGCDGAQSIVRQRSVIGFADMDGDCLPDLVIGTRCGLEVWFNGARSNKAFWQLRANSSDVRMFDKSVFDDEGGDHAMSLADMNSDGTMDILMANKQRKDVRVHLNEQRRRAVGQLCTAAEEWKLRRVQAVGAGELTLKEGRLGPLFGGISVPCALRVGDYDLDGWADVVAVDASTELPVLFRNSGDWSHSRALKRVERKIERGLQKGNGGAVSVGFFDTDESGRQDLVVVRGGNETRLVWNNVLGEWDRMFFKGTVLSALGFRLEERPFAPVAGNSVKLSYAERGHRKRRRRVCSQGGASGYGGWVMSAGSCTFGMANIANYVEELWVGGGKNSRAWTGLMPNSMAVVWAEGGGEGDASAWWMEFFTQRRGGPMLRVVAALMGSLLVLAAVIGALQHAERKRDLREAARHRLRLFSFA
ncbi:T-cell immunomodulatory protein [Gracilariopsis chorda]|uniref:T-cell immunomodulatory protein n=1 Tax=Gracilariopsis chorda TaxID=448386 RepID=A0A2V3IGT4_9FLOR|nr:T-cell immunomodulatory protein [Gracilariopsis chorda]|eukprot:PXF41248.1 T-cell immunomodulatory protein [Gracilariopsis chorda]